MKDLYITEIIKNMDLNELIKYLIDLKNKGCTHLEIDNYEPLIFAIFSQPERSKREDSKEMRCSEHYGNIVRGK